MNKYKDIIRYMNLEKHCHLGCDKFTPLIIMINEDKKIIKELLDTDYEHYNNLLTFLSYGFRGILNYGYNDKYDLETIYNDIVYVLETFNNLSEELKWEINGEDFIKLLKRNRG